MPLESIPCPLSANFSPVTPVYDRSLLSVASHNAIPPPLPVFTLGSSSHMELPTVIEFPSPVRRGKKPSKSLNNNSVLVSSDSSSSLKNLLPHHRAQLYRAWATSPRVPTVNSRRAWARARGISPLVVHTWFNSRKWRAKNQNQPIDEGTYDLPVGNPNNDLDIDEETRPDAFVLSPAADSSLSTPSLVPDSPISVTSSFVPGSSPPSPTVLITSVKRPICTRKVAPKRRTAAKAKPSAISLPAARVSVQKARNPHPRERQVTFGPPFDPRLGFLFADGPCSIKAFPRFPSWQECSTLAGDVDGYLNLLPAPQSTSPLLIGASQTEAANLEMLKDAFSGAERRTTYHRGETLVGERTFVR